MNREPALAAAIAAVVKSFPNRRVPLEVLLNAAAAVDRTAAASVGWRARIHHALDDLANDGHIMLSKTRFDHSALPPLPLFVVAPPSAPTAPRPISKPVWHAALAWAADMHDSGALTTADRGLLELVNAWLPRRRGVHVPLRERSLEIFGDEKALDTILPGPLFAPGRLTLDLLETYPCWPPVTQTLLGTKIWLLVENYTTYHSIAERARELDFDGRIIWGAGNQVSTRISALAPEPPPAQFFYFGDIDLGGFHVARTAATRAAQAGLPPLTAARGLYQLALDHGQRRPLPEGRAIDSIAAWTHTWLGGELGKNVTALIRLPQRIVQEHVGRELLSNTTLLHWFDER